MQNKEENEISPEPSPGGGWMSNRKLWFGAAALILVVIVALVLIWVLPSSDNGGDVAQEDTAQPAEEEAVGEEEEPVEAGGEKQGGESITVTPGDGSSGYTVDFPDPVDSADDPAPEGGYTDIAGAWVIDMSGSIYALTNCHLNLENGQINTPDDYDQVFEVMASQYSWDKENSTFNADLQVVVKMGSSGSLSVPANLKLEGTVDGSLARIDGDFYAEPQGEAYAMYSEQGVFIMHR